MSRIDDVSKPLKSRFALRLSDGRWEAQNVDM
jgi:hypothetical protein